MKMYNFKKIIILILAGLSFLILGFTALIWFDDIPLEDATPPAGIRTLSDFENWKGEDVLGDGSYIDTVTGESYQVLLGPSGRFFASGPSAYLFDSNGHFTEWTPDMGDVFTDKSGFDLSSGNLKR